jgi:hypothetical protein
MIQEMFYTFLDIKNLETETGTNEIDKKNKEEIKAIFKKKFKKELMFDVKNIELVAKQMLKSTNKYDVWIYCKKLPKKLLKN